MLIILTLVLLSTPAFAQSPLTSTVETPVTGGRQFEGEVTLEVDGAPAARRLVLRLLQKWHGTLVIGAHGGNGGPAFAHPPVDRRPVRRR